MRTRRLILRTLLYHWRTNLAVAAGVAVAVSVLTGALMVGDSVRSSLRSLALARIGRTDSALQASRLFREHLAEEIGGGAAVPLLALEGITAVPSSGRRASKVLVYGVDERFWRFHGVADAPLDARGAWLSEPLAGELGAAAGDAILLRVEKPAEIPKESLFGRKENSIAAAGFSVRGTLPAARLGEFSLAPRQGSVRAMFVSLARLQKELGQQGKVNTVLVAGKTDAAAHITLEDRGLKVRPVAGGVQIESPAGLLPDHVVKAIDETAAEFQFRPVRLFTYLVNAIASSGRSIPYSLVTAIDLPQLAGEDDLILNDWAAGRLGVAAGDSIRLEFYVWRREGRLETAQADFRMSGLTPVNGPLGDPAFAPEYPGITDTRRLKDWDPPFPLDLRRIGKPDEDYWDRHRTTPKAYIRLDRGQRLWQSRFGKVSSVRLTQVTPEFLQALRKRLDPREDGFVTLPVRQQNLAASAGATDFGEYFTYFSFFLVFSALLLVSLLFRLGIEQRVREIGILASVGFTRGNVRRIFLVEAVVLLSAGCLLGAAGAAGYGSLIIYGLRTWWRDAVGTSLIELHPSARSLLVGVFGGFAAAMLAILVSLRELRNVSPAGLLAGPQTDAATRPARWLRWLAAISASGASILLGAAAVGILSQTIAFFGAAALLLAACCCGARLLLSWRSTRPIVSQGYRGLMRLGLRSAATRPGRSVLSIALIACATFLLVSLDSFRRSPVAGGEGAYQMLAESLVSVYFDLNSPYGRGVYSLDSPRWNQVEVVSFRMRPGDDASCLNLYRPQNPRVLGAPASFLRAGQEKANPWLLLERAHTDGTIPAAVDANSMTYVLHKKLGDEILAGNVRLKLVAALRDSVFQSELIISESNFLRAFPSHQGFRFFLLKGPVKAVEGFAAAAEDALADAGFDASLTADRLAQFHRVENTYISTFQILGGLGLLIGTLGLAVVLMRNVLERRRELALLWAVGYNPSHIAWIVLAENVLLLAAGVAAGTLCAALAVAPALASHGRQTGIGSLLLLPSLVILTGVIASAAATRAAIRAPLLEFLRAE